MTPSKLEAAIQTARAVVDREPPHAMQTSLELALQDLLDALVGVPGSAGHKIDEMWAWVMLDDTDGNEGIPAWLDGNVMMPLVGADLDMAIHLRPTAQLAASAGGHPITLRRFSEMTILETLEP